MSKYSELLRRKFERIGARAIAREQFWFRIDIRNDRKGEYFDITLPQDPDAVVEAIDVRPSIRHLLLLVKDKYSKDKFLCGHDERHWFVAAVPGSRVSTVTTALENLKPAEVRQAEQRKRIRMCDRMRRRNAAFIRQGEWFFVPAPDVYIRESRILRNEPLRRGFGSKPHTCEQLCRGLRRSDWWSMRLEEVVFARGRVWHPDHKTVFLEGWHRVLMNTESQASGRGDVRFMD